jgi:hypothetical protein
MRQSNPSDPKNHKAYYEPDDKRPVADIPILLGPCLEVWSKNICDRWKEQSENEYWEIVVKGERYADPNRHHPKDVHSESEIGIRSHGAGDARCSGGSLRLSDSQVIRLSGALRAQRSRVVH